VGRLPRRDRRSMASSPISVSACPSIPSARSAAVTLGLPRSGCRRSEEGAAWHSVARPARSPRNRRRHRHQQPSQDHGRPVWWPS
jgi:hypothetical protein